uniref:Ovule protein n=1 Tax=Steinernema glaseri TaxID=37863 RepID=A0A1I7Z8X8_9BILA
MVIGITVKHVCNTSVTIPNPLIPYTCSLHIQSPLCSVFEDSMVVSVTGIHRGAMSQMPFTSLCIPIPLYSAYSGTQSRTDPFVHFDHSPLNLPTISRPHPTTN